MSSSVHVCAAMETHKGEGILSVIEKHLRPVLSTESIDVNVPALRDWAVLDCGGRRCFHKMLGQGTGGGCETTKISPSILTRKYTMATESSV